MPLDPLPMHYRGKFSNVQAALGLAGLRRLPEFIERTRRHAWLLLAAANACYTAANAVWSWLQTSGIDDPFPSRADALYGGFYLLAAAATQRTKRLKLLMYGNLLPLHDPLRLAEDIAVVDHPYFAVTGTDGAFTIDNVPPGRQT